MVFNLFAPVNSSSLLDALWFAYNLDELNEATRIASFGGLDLVKQGSGTIGHIAGLQGNALTTDGNAAIGNTSAAPLALGTGNGSNQAFSVWLNVYLNNKTATQSLLSMRGSAFNETTVAIQYFQTSDRLRAVMGNTAGSAATTNTGNTHGSPAVSTWLSVYFEYDAVIGASNGTARISINNGAFDTSSHSNGTYASAPNFSIGKAAQGNTEFSNARIDRVFGWKRKLTTTERTFLHTNTSIGYPFA
jgi:hypothetical protein